MALIVLCRPVQPAFGVPQPRLHALELAPTHECPDKLNAQHRPDADYLVGKRLKPVEQGGILSALAQRRDRQLDQLRGSLVVLAGQRVADRLGPLAILFVPVACPPVQGGNVLRLLVEQARMQHVGKELVIAIPPAMINKRDQEEVSSLERRQPGLSAILAGDGITEGPTQSVQDGGLQQEVLDIFGLALQDLLGQIVDDVPVIPGEAGDEPGHVVSPCIESAAI